ncbi:MAG: nucleoside triphosphate pyrophosphohydrolase family protein [Bacteroidales bacterium]|jgi:NTP pyrophosphatase (non-canonical NTP hydrolase)|nr:nucleoside triphosphate pyrophosphohydrolase family protein [Bacteroidales bacterium]
MDNKEYLKEVLKTESTDMNLISERVSQDSIIRLLHAAMGVATEAGEFLDAIKKHIFYGKPLDTVNLIEELGDLYWYINVAQDVLNVSTEDVQVKNVNKLRARYGETFSEKSAITRNLQIEEKALKGE